MQYAPKEFVDWLIYEMKNRGWSIRVASRNFGISHPLIYSIINDSEQPSFETCKAIAKAFGLRAEDVLIRAGLLQKSVGYNERTQEMVGLFSDLGEDDQEELLQLAHIKNKRKRRQQEINGS